MSTGWGKGYVTDIGYEAGYYLEQTPGQLKLACLLNGIAWDVPAEGAHYMELGCGLGATALAIAAANPSWRITGLDFNPAHVAAARQLAREAGLDNAHFLEADLSGFAESPAAAALPEADIVTAHGVWSWVAPAVREGIVRLLQARLAAGGVFHVSYNALPGWQTMLAMQRLTREAGLRLAGRSDRQAQAGLELVRELMEAGTAGLRGDVRIAGWIERIAALSPAYLAHELMNANWQPCWHAEVAGALAAAKLDYAAAATLIENFPELVMTAPQRALHDRFEDPLVRELVKDSCAMRTLRHDVYVRGGRRLSSAGRDAAIAGLTLALAVPEERVELALKVAAGTAELAPAFYRPVAAMLARGPARVGALLRAPGAVANRENPAELAGLLVGTRQATVLLRPGAPATPRLARANAAFAERFAVAHNLRRNFGLASEAVGAALACDTPTMFLAGRVLAGEEAGDEHAWARELAADLPEDAQEPVAEALRQARANLAPLRAAGCLA